MSSLKTSVLVLPTLLQYSSRISNSNSSILKSSRFFMAVSGFMLYNSSMKARYRYRFYPTDQQRQSLAQLFGCVRVVWNDALAFCKQAEKLPKNGDLQKWIITQAKKTTEREWLSERWRGSPYRGEAG